MEACIGGYLRQAGVRGTQAARRLRHQRAHLALLPRVQQILPAEEIRDFLAFFLAEAEDDDGQERLAVGGVGADHGALVLLLAHRVAHLLRQRGVRHLLAALCLRRAPLRVHR